LIEKLSIHKNHLNNIGMYLNKEDKQKIFAKHGKDRNDSGTAEAQIALFTRRIEAISNHLKTNKKDHNSKKALVQLVGKRRDLLNYLVKKDITRYRNIIKELKLRK